MPAQPFQLYEAVVVNGAPDGAPPGHLTVQIPELFGTDELPRTIAPLFPGWSAGGWQSVPAPETPDGETTRVIVAQIGPDSFRWMGTSQSWSSVTDLPGDAAGARSGDGKSRAMLSKDGAFLDHDSGSFVHVNSDGTAELQGKTAKVSGTQFVWLYDGGSVAPLEPYPLTRALLNALALLAQDVTAVGLGIPSLLAVPTPGAASLISGVTQSLASGPPYLSTRIFGS